jgi:hypothetical protein
MKNEKFLIFGKYKIGPPSKHKAVSPGAEHAGANYKHVATMLRLFPLKRIGEARVLAKTNFDSILKFDP